MQNLLVTSTTKAITHICNKTEFRIFLGIFYQVRDSKQGNVGQLHICV